MAKGFNLKAVFDADTKGIEDGSKKAIKSVEEFADQSSDMLDQMAGKFGVNTNHLKEFRHILKSMGQAWVEGFGGGEEMMGNVISKMALLGTTATAAAALVAGAFKLMKKEADAYRQTIEGSIGEKGLKAYLSTYQQALYDINTQSTASMVETTNSWRKGFKTLWADFKNMAVNALYLVKEKGIEFGAALGMGWAKTKAITPIAGAKAASAEQLVMDIAKWERDLSNIQNKVIEKEAKIQELRALALDTEIKASERKKYLEQIQGLINDKAKIQLDILKKIENAYKEIAEILPNSIEAQDAYTNAVKATNSILKQQKAEKTNLSRLQNSINRDLEKEIEYREYLLSLDKQNPELEKQQTAFRASLIGAPSTDEINNILFGGAPPVVEIDTTLKPIKPKDVEKVIVDLARVIEDSIQSMAYGIGELIGDLATGGDAMQNFGKAVLSTFADAAIAVGKMAIQMGLAAEGVKQALKFGNPYVAIAAGAALVALGAAVKAGMSNIASGSYASSPSYSQGTRAVGTGGLVTRELTVNVQGTLVAQGSQLVAVLNNENKRRKVTT